MRLVGEAGIGKSRLVREFLARVERRGAVLRVVVRQDGCSSLGEQHFGVLGAIVRGAAGDRAEGNAGRHASRNWRPGCRARAGGRGADADAAARPCLGLGDPEKALRQVEPEQLRRQVLFAVRAIFERRLALLAVLIIVEDLHWADAVSIEALRFVMDRLERTRLMMLVTERPGLEHRQLESSASAMPRFACRPSTEPGGTHARRLLGETGHARKPPKSCASGSSSGRAETRSSSRRSSVA